jgi:hypothetical protein
MDSMVRSQLSAFKGRLHQETLAGELPESPSMKNPSLGVGVAGAQPHDTLHSQLASTSGHSEWTIVSLG